MKVCELIEHLKKFNPDFPVWYCGDFVNDTIYQLTSDNVRSYELEDEFGKEFSCVLLGDVP